MFQSNSYFKKIKENTTFWGHIDVLRVMIIRVILIWLILAVVYFLFMNWIFDHIIIGPCHNNFIFYKWIDLVGAVFSSGSTSAIDMPEIHLINYNLTTPFLLQINTSFNLALMTALPYLFYELWVFIKPALYKKEKKGVRLAFFLGAGMFYLGVLVGYFLVFPMTLQFLANYQLSDSIQNQLSL